MWENNARTWFTVKNGMEPERSIFIGSFPEDAPTHVVYQMSTSDIEEMGIEGIDWYVIQEITEGGLLTRTATDEEVKFITETGSPIPELD